MRALAENTLSLNKTLMLFAMVLVAVMTIGAAVFATMPSGRHGSQAHEQFGKPAPATPSRWRSTRATASAASSMRRVCDDLSRENSDAFFGKSEPLAGFDQREVGLARVR